jgi:hypothetical protein
VTEHQLGVAVNGRAHQLRGRLVSFPLPEHAGGTGLDATYQFDDAPERVVV